MTQILSILALGLAFGGFMIMGDFSQKFYKPGLKTVLWVKHHQYWLIATSAVLWVAAFVLHQTGNGAAPAILALTGILGVFFTVMGYFAPPYILFRTIRNGHAKWITAEEADRFLDSQESVVGIEINGDARAYPISWIRGPHIVEETIGAQQVSMTFCMLTNLGQAYNAKDQLLNFITPMQWNNNLVVYDTHSKRLFQQIGDEIGEANATPLFETYPTRIMSWAAWRKFYPETQVFYNPPGSLRDRLVRLMLKHVIDPAHLTNDKAFFPTIDYADKRLPSNEKVIGIRSNSAAQAYTTDYLKEARILNTTFEDAELLIVADPESDAIDIFKRSHNGTALDFNYEENNGTFVMHDSETGSKWDFYGRAVDGQLKGQQLERVNHASMVYWIVWSNFYPETALIQ